MATAERFATGMGTILGVQATPIQNITDLVLLDLSINQTNIAPERSGTLLLVVDGDLYNLPFVFVDEAYDQRTQQGYPKQRNPQAVSR